MKEKLQNEKLDSLFRGILSLETIDECYDFFSDLCTISEIKSMCQRFDVAKQLNDKNVYTNIEAETGASSATISRVNRSLLYGSGGYRAVLDKMKDEDNE